MDTMNEDETSWQGKTKFPRLHIDLEGAHRRQNSITSLKAIFRQLRWLHRNEIPTPSTNAVFSFSTENKTLTLKVDFK